MNKKPIKIGRPRHYDLVPLPGFANRELALEASMLQELAERVYDQISDLPLQALDYSPAGTNLSIARLVVHMAWAEATWVSRLTGEPVPEDMQRELDAGRLEDFSSAPASAGEAAELLAFCRRVQQQYSVSALGKLADIDTPMEAGGRTVNVRGVIAQLQWHWTYHSGQIGLLRLLWGSDYQWTNEAIIGTSPYS